jgi:hypothetical protein
MCIILRPGRAPVSEAEAEAEEEAEATPALERMFRAVETGPVGAAADA